MTAKKRGRKKKRGPKKKLPPKQYKERNTWNYKIISCRNMKQVDYFGKFATPKDAYAFIGQLMNKTKSVIFPKKIVNNKNGYECVDEYLILERKTDNKEVLLRNEFGKLVKHRTTTERWDIFDKFRYYTEETFWVYGYDPVYARKTFMWIYENIICDGIGKYSFKRVFVYGNKIIVKNDSNTMDIILCKNKSDAIRFYNLLCEYTKKDNITSVFFGGAYSGQGKRTSNIVNELCDYTGWSRKKVIRSTLF